MGSDDARAAALGISHDFAALIQASCTVLNEEVRNCNTSYLLAEKQDKAKARAAYPDSPWLWFMEPRFLELWKALADLSL